MTPPHPNSLLLYKLFTTKKEGFTRLQMGSQLEINFHYLCQLLGAAQFTTSHVQRSPRRANIISSCRCGCIYIYIYILVLCSLVR